MFSGLCIPEKTYRIPVCNYMDPAEPSLILKVLQFKSHPYASFKFNFYCSNP